MENVEFWEFELICDISKRYAIEYLENKLKLLIKNHNGVLVTNYSKNTITLVLGVKSGLKMAVKPYLYSMIADVIINVYKLDYLRYHFDFKLKDDLLLKSFLKGLVCFDSDFENQIIYTKLINFDKINLEAFVDFRLKFLKAKWDDLVSLANDNYLYLLSGGNFFELMKFLLSNLESKVDTLEVKFDSGVFQLVSGGEILDLPFMANNKNQEDLVSSIVSLSPKFITIFDGKNLNQEVETFLHKLFENRLKIVK